MKAYLDIDGVILANNKQITNYAEEFIKYVVDNYDTYWLTTHCKGDSNHTIQLLSRFFRPEIIAYLKKIKPTNWRTWKTEAINFGDEFLWFDDQLFETEKQVLRSKGKFSSWVQINLSSDPDQLRDLID